MTKSLSLPFLFWGSKCEETNVAASHTFTDRPYNGIVFQAARHRWHQTSQNRTAEVSEVKPEECSVQSNGPVWLRISTDEGFHYKDPTDTLEILHEIKPYGALSKL